MLTTGSRDASDVCPKDVEPLDAWLPERAVDEDRDGVGD